MPIVTDPDLATVYFKDDRLVPNSGSILYFGDGTITRGNKQAVYRLTGEYPVKRKRKKQGKSKVNSFTQQLSMLIKHKNYFDHIKKTRKTETLLNNYTGIVRSFLGCFCVLCGTNAIKCTDIDVFIKVFCGFTRTNFAMLYRMLEKGYREREIGNTALYRVSEIDRNESRFKIRFHKCLQEYYGIYEFLWVNRSDIVKHKKQKPVIEEAHDKISALPKVVLIKHL